MKMRVAASNAYPIPNYLDAKQVAVDDFTVNYVNMVLAIARRERPAGVMTRAAVIAGMDRCNFRRIVHAAQRIEKMRAKEQRGARVRTAKKRSVG